MSRAKSFRECTVVGRQPPAKLVLDPFPADPHPGRRRQVDDLSELVDGVLPHPFIAPIVALRRVEALPRGGTAGAWWTGVVWSIL